MEVSYKKFELVIGRYIMNLTRIFCAAMVFFGEKVLLPREFGIFSMVIP